MKKTGLLILFFLSFHFVNAQFFKIPASQIEIDSSTIIPDGQDRLKVNTDVICSIDGLTDSLITRVQFKDTLTTIASRYKLNLKVDSIYKSHDSIFYCANGNCEFSFKDSSGTSGGGSQNLQSVTDVGNTTNDSIISTSVIKAASFYATEKVTAVSELKSNGDLNVGGVAVVDGDVLCGSNVEVNGGVEILGSSQFYGDIFANALPLNTPQILQVDDFDKVIGTGIDPSDLLLKSGNLSGLTNASTSRTNLGGTTVGQNIFTLSNPSAITFPRINADNSISALSASAMRTALGAGTGSGDALVSNPLSQFASTTSAQLRSVLSDEDGTGNFLTTNGSAVSLTNFPTLNQNTSGNAATATALLNARNINGVAFDGTADITVNAAAGTLTGTTLNSTVVSASLTSVGTLTNLTVTNPITGSISGNAATVTTNANLTGDVTSSGNATTLSEIYKARTILLTADKAVLGSAGAVEITDGTTAWNISLASNDKYTFDIYIPIVTSGTSGGFLNITFPAGAICNYTMVGNNTTATAVVSSTGTASNTNTGSFVLYTAAVPGFVTLKGSIINSSTSGNLSIRIGDNNAGQTVTAKAGAFFKYQKL